MNAEALERYERALGAVALTALTAALVAALAMAVAACLAAIRVHIRRGRRR